MSLTLVAISLTAMAGVGAVAVDLGMLYKARAEAQQAAEAGALAGASVFLDVAPDAVTAEARARELAEANTILNSPVKPSEVEVTPDMGAERVWVRVVRPGIGMWFARVLGENTVRVGAVAAAGVTEASGANCVSPIMMPDAWGDDTEDLGIPWENQIDQWSYGNGDTYGEFNRPGPQTGYGSGYRNGYADTYNNDYGRPITLTPQSPTNLGPGAYQLWAFPNENIDPDWPTQCNPRSVSLGGGSRYDVENGGLPSESLSELSDLIQDDPGTTWDTGQGRMESTSYTDWRQSPRVIKVALYDPIQIQQMQSGSPDVEFSNVALFFLENVDQGAGTVTGRLLYFSAGNNDDGGTAGALVKRVKLVE